MQVFTINDIPEFSKKERIVVVGVIGKSPYRRPNKTTPLLSSVKSDENGIQCHWDERRSVLYLHAVTYLDTARLAELAAELDENSKSTEKDADASHWLVASGELAADSCRIMALLFHLCHIVVLSHPTPVFDMGYLQLFKAIDAYRAALWGRSTGALSGLGGAWAAHGRACCPRLVLHARRAPPALRRRDSLKRLKRLEHAVEDHLYFILRKARIITNVCAKSLFAIPKNEEFVYINTEENEGARDVSSLVRELVLRCDGTAGDAAQDSRPSFTQFLRAHIDLAFSEGFDDNVGKYAMSTSFFELPSAATWREAAQALLPVYLQPDPDPEDEPSAALFDALATDVRFSQARCAKVLPIAQASYSEGLPSHYSTVHHMHMMGVALASLSAMARGPLAGAARGKLRAACRAHHRARQLCEAASLSGHPCILPAHDSSVEHSSGVKYVSACNCGRTKCTREDPYTVEAANYTFYKMAAEKCPACPTLQYIEFPVFQPSTPTFRAASLKASSSQEGEEKHRSQEPEADAEAEGEVEAENEGEGEAEGEGEGDGGAWSVADALSPGSDEDASPVSDGYVVAVRGDSSSEKGLVRQPSTTEYLPGMPHRGSPAGLLPAFPSWSLACLGVSSLYSHSAGLPDHLHPGLLLHANHLLPWDCAVRYHLHPGLLLHANHLLPWDCAVRYHLHPGLLLHANHLLPWDCAVRYHLHPGLLLHANHLLPWDCAVRYHLHPGLLLHANHLLPWDCAVRYHLHPGLLLHANHLLPWDCAVRYHLHPGLLLPAHRLLLLDCAVKYRLLSAYRLLPWDCAVRMEQAGLFRRVARGKAATSHHLTVKIFIGFEYECPRGHRFMMSSPDTIVSGGSALGGGGPRGGSGAGARLAATDMPLAAPCPCRERALLARLHVVTPKAPVHVTLTPQVQPVPGGPVFVAGPQPLRLSASAYWVLRLPRVYCDERGPLPRRAPAAAHSLAGHLLAPVFGLQD